MTFTEVCRITCNEYDDVERVESAILFYMNNERGGVCPAMWSEDYMRLRSELVRALESTGKMPFNSHVGHVLPRIHEHKSMESPRPGTFQTIVYLPRDFVVMLHVSRIGTCTVVMGWNGDVYVASNDREIAFMRDRWKQQQKGQRRVGEAS